ncbi:hypothetical protein [Cypionkella sp.]|uniref:hypothetical protein n=1 Tax=Cypionkella sp. TaxID=2811411 RepID=UPI002604EEBF|nr:hypothetical protein [Cypionkella sp.]
MMPLGIVMRQAQSGRSDQFASMAATILISTTAPYSQFGSLNGFVHAGIQHLELGQVRS